MGTTNLRVLSEEAPIALSGNLTRDAWLALANAAQALLRVAQAGLGENVSSPVKLSLSHLPLVTHTAHNASIGVAEGINQMLIAKARAGLSERYIRTLRNSLSKFARGRCNQPMDSVTPEHLELWLAESDWAPDTKAGYLSDVCILYNFHMKRGNCTTNPAAAVSVAESDEGPIAVHTPEQTRIVMETARELDLDVMRCMALRYFGGLRAIEAESQSESDIGDEILKVTRAKKRTRARRPVTILPVLHAWLGVGGRLPLKNAGQKMAALVKAVAERGVPWPQNAPRHSFCSYHLAMFENAAKTARQAGHSEQILFNRYNGEVTKIEAEKFLNLMPGAESPRV